VQQAPAKKSSHASWRLVSRIADLKRVISKERGNKSDSRNLKGSSDEYVFITEKK
jgi:hypothetical protein